MILFGFGLSPVDAQAPAGSVSILIVDSRSQAVPGASATLQGATSQTALSDPSGNVTFAGVPPGIYTLSVSKSGFETTAQNDIVIAEGQALTINVSLPAASFSSLTEIGRVSTATAGQVTLNRSSTTSTTVPASAMTVQGATQVSQVLQQVPGLSLSGVDFSQPNPGGQFGVPSLRGALPYETAISIDGHPVAVGNSGTYNIAYLTPYALQSVEVIRGPSATVPTINNAVGGSINFRTLEPTQKPLESVDYSLDSEQGSFINLKATGTTGRLSYALDYYSFGSPGPYKNTEEGYAPFFGGSINGVPISQSAWSPAPYYARPGFAASSEDVDTMFACCATINSDYQLRSDLAKLRYNIGQATNLTLSYLNGNMYENLQGDGNGSYPQVFEPAAGYVGSYPVGATSNCCEEAIAPNNYWITNTNLFQGELSSAIGPVTLLGRYYSGYNYTVYNYGGTGGNSYNLDLWGSLFLGPGNGTLTYFNGTPVTYSTPFGEQFGRSTTDKFGGYSLQAELAAGPNSYSVIYDSLSTQSNAISYDNSVGSYTIPAGSGQQQQTITQRAQLALSKTVHVDLSNYFVQYTDHSTVNSGLTFQNYTHSFDGVRLGSTWQPSSDVSVRFGLGSSIVPPYLSLVSQSTNAPVPNSEGSPTYFTQSANNPDLQPETGFGYDFGVDKRIGSGIVVSGDVYLTHLENQFLTSQAQSGMYTGPISLGDPSSPIATLPLFLTTAGNLGNSMYEGVELTVKRAPVTGFGFALQASLQRGFAYNLPAGFYNTTSGPYTTNLGIVQGVNFCGSGPGYNGLSVSGCIPYSQGYAEANYQTKNLFFRLGMTYFGNNNSYSWPAFTVLSASVRAKLSPNLTATLSGDNLGASHANSIYQNYEDGAALPLANGQLGFLPSYQYGPEIVRLTLGYTFGNH
jgi:outer membrane receptor protein involved in Fe transport